MNLGVKFSFVLMTMAISICTIGNYQIIHATTNSKNQDSTSTTIAKPNNLNSKISTANTPIAKPTAIHKDLTTTIAKPNNLNSKISTANTPIAKPTPNQEPIFLLPFSSNFADPHVSKDLNIIPFP